MQTKIIFEEFSVLYKRFFCLKLILGTYTLVFLVFFSKAQSHTIVHGRIMDIYGVPIERVSVRETENKGTALTNDNGDFYLEVPDFPIDLEIFKDGYKSESINYFGQSTVEVRLKETGPRKNSNPTASENLRDVTGSNFDVAFNELLAYEVQMVSNRKESISNSPAIVSVLDMEEFMSMGVLNLKEALNYVPGVVVQEETLGTTTVMMRTTADVFNQKVLFLLDGVPNWMSAQGEFAILALPLALIDRVEIIRGPGSALFGTNASGGIINVITKKSKPEISAIAYSGSLGTYNANVSFVRTNPEGLNVSVGSSFQQMTEGYTALIPNTVFTPPLGLPPNQNQAGQIFPGNFLVGEDGNLLSHADLDSSQLTKTEEFFNFTLRLEYKGLEFISNYITQHQNGLGGIAVAYNNNSIDYTGLLNHLKFTKSFDNNTFSLYGDHSILFQQIDAENYYNYRTDVITDVTGTTYNHYFNPISFKFSEPFKNNYRTRVGTNLDFVLDDNTSLLFGVEGEVRSSGDYELRDRSAGDTLIFNYGKSISINESSAFIQLDYQLDRWRFLLGGRAVNNEIAGTSVNPRIALIYNFNESNSLKFLFNQGFNSPAIMQQVNLDIPFVIRGSNTLKAETVRSFDIAYTHAAGDRLFVVNGFLFSTDNIISLQREVVNDATRIDDGFEIDTYTNLDGFTRWGIETEIQQKISHFNFFLNAAYNHQGTEALSDDFLARFVPKYTSSVGGRYISSKHEFGFTSRIISPRGRVSEEADFINVTNLSYTYYMGDFGIFLVTNNIFDQEIFHPDVTRNTVALVQGGPGRTIYGGIRWKRR